jgi:hypothetical protein
MPTCTPFALGDGQGNPEPVLAFLQVVHGDPGELATAERAGKADQQQGAIAYARQVVGDCGDDLGQNGDPRGELGPGTIAGLAGDAVEPA